MSGDQQYWPLWKTLIALLMVFGFPSLLAIGSGLADVLIGTLFLVVGAVGCVAFAAAVVYLQQQGFLAGPAGDPGDPGGDLSDGDAGE